MGNGNHFPDSGPPHVALHEAAPDPHRKFATGYRGSAIQRYAKLSIMQRIGRSERSDVGGTGLYCR